MTYFVFLLILFFILLLGSWYAYRVAFYSPISKRPTETEPLQGDQYDAVAEDISRISSIMRRYPFEEVTIPSDDGLNLFGRYYHFKDGAPVEILFHGYRSHPYRDCGGGHSLARKMGFNALVVDQRAHGKSDGDHICFGVKESHDCLRWAEYVAGRFGADIPIILSGLSMGAATVLMASCLDLPEQVVCIIGDSPYSTPQAIIEKVCKDKHYPVALCRPALHLAASLFAGFPLNGATAKDAVAHAKVPILLIHGEADHFVPCPMSMEIAACCSSRVEVATFPDAGHGLSYITDPIRYEKVVCNFLLSIPQLKDSVSQEYIQKLHENI